MSSLSLLKVTVWSPGGTPQNNLHALSVPYLMVLLLPKCVLNLTSFSIPTVITSPLGCSHDLLIDRFTSGLCFPHPVYDPLYSLPALGL